MQSVTGMLRPDRFLAGSTLAAAGVCMILFLATAMYGAGVLTQGASLRSLEVLLAELALASGAAAAIRLWYANRVHAVTIGYLFVCLSGLVIGMGGCSFWFNVPMHELTFGLPSHGRWCGLLLDDAFKPAYVIRSDTAPLFLFGPLIALVAWRGWRVIRRQRTRDRRLTSSGP